MQALISLVLIALLTSCTPAASHYTQNIQNYRGASANTVMQAFGTPYQKLTQSNGNTVLIYKSSSYASGEESYTPAIGVNVNAAGVPVMTSGNPNVAFNRVPVVSTCTMAFEINKNNTVVNTQAMGTNCAQVDIKRRAAN